MKTGKIISELVRLLVLSGVYKDEVTALKDIIITHIGKKIENYKKIIQTLQRKFNTDFDTFTRDIKNKVTSELEDEWMEWKGAIEMKEAWNEALKEVMKSEAKI